MRKISFVLSISLVFVLLFSGCGQAGQLGTVSAPPEVTPSGEPATSGDIPAASPSPEASPQLKLDNELRTQTFLAFIKDSYPQLSEAFFGGISGIGFIDLDCDTGVEMLIFDSGASASMGLQFFDIIDDKVECVSANLTSVKDAYAKEHYSDVIVNANTFDSFRMMLDSATEKKFFLVSRKLTLVRQSAVQQQVGHFLEAAFLRQLTHVVATVSQTCTGLAHGAEFGLPGHLATQAGATQYFCFSHGYRSSSGKWSGQFFFWANSASSFCSKAW